jgi:hypothetical protein
MVWNIPVGGSYTPVPAGICQARCFQVLDLGLQASQFGTQHKIVIRWITPHLGDDGAPLSIREMYTLSLDKKANLYKALKGWGGKAADGDFDLEMLIGAPAMLNIVHDEKDDKTYSNVDSISPGDAKTAVAIPGDLFSDFIKFPEWEKLKVAGDGIHDALRTTMTEGWLMLQAKLESPPFIAVPAPLAVGPQTAANSPEAAALAAAVDGDVVPTKQFGAA